MPQQKNLSTSSLERPQPRPPALLGIQFVSRCIGIIASLIGVAIAAFIAIKIHKTWAFVFISTLLPFFLDTAEVAALASRRTLKFSFHRVNPFVLIGLDILTIGLLIWSFSSLIFDKWSKSHAVSTGSYTADPFNGIEMWLAVTIGACHIILLVFDFVDCFSRRATGSSKRPIEISLPRLIPSNRGYGSGRVGDVEWG
ncbi:hypothetical protein NA56DRAFT_641250 [Hyaloscypha hepaticicola]|uniref:Uncharacterized protein n=1 Tax=Hyaloscypha hepaticicola TaxID=2082293 RepID=A0A2J6QJV3_9HELO|nr:hypothetical protein NA56DRAFT_641250 [Hyaloscypha hepaticicola]